MLFCQLKGEFYYSRRAIPQGVLNSSEACLSWKAIRKPGVLPWLHSYSCQACFKELGITSTYLIHLISRMVYRHILFHSSDLITCERIPEPKPLFLINKIIAILREYKIKLSFTWDKNSKLLLLCLYQTNIKEYS